MLNHISNVSTSLLLDKVTLPVKDRDLYVYGFSILYSSCFIVFSILFLASIFGGIEYGVYFFAIFIPLRTYTGGYHSQSYRGCFLVSNICYLITFFIANLFMTSINSFFIIFLTVLLSIYIFYKSPIENINQKLTANQIKQCKIKVYYILLFDVSIITILCITNYWVCFVRMATATILMVAVLLYITKKKGENHECKQHL